MNKKESFVVKEQLKAFLQEVNMLNDIEEYAEENNMIELYNFLFE